jgi:hypothetical protein
MEIRIKQGEKFRFVTDDSDGEFEVHYNTEEHPDSFVIKEVAGLPGNKIGAANAILYQEDFGCHITLGDEEECLVGETIHDALYSNPNPLAFEKASEKDKDTTHVVDLSNNLAVSRFDEQLLHHCNMTGDDDAYAVLSASLKDIRAANNYVSIVQQDFPDQQSAIDHAINNRKAQIDKFWNVVDLQCVDAKEVAEMPYSI